MISEYLQNIVSYINEITENIFAPLDRLIENIPMPEWLSDAIIDSLHLLPLLFIVFIVIEIIEFFFSEKINILLKKLEKAATLIGSLAAVIPQCGFSVIASTLYIKKYITKGTLIGIYLATSDEAIPVLLTDEQAIVYVIPIICFKIAIAIIAGYLIDFILKDKKYIFHETQCHHHECEEEEGCCSHSVSNRRKRELLYHPLKHTFNIFLFILLITIVLNYIFSIYDLAQLFGNIGIFEPVLTSIIGLIPNCAVSIAIALMLMKGTISFGAAMSGLLSNAGLGILVLLRHKENLKDTLMIVLILLAISIISGIILNYLDIGII